MCLQLCLSIPISCFGSTKQLCSPHQMSNSADDSSHTSGNNHGIVIAIVVVVVIIIIAVASYICSRVFCSVQYHCCEPDHGNNPDQGNNPLRGQSSNNLQLAKEGRINSEQSRQKGKRGTSRSCCSICLADYRKDDELRSMPDCKHLFHRECIDQWLRVHPMCPLCRKSLQPTN